QEAAFMRATLEETRAIIDREGVVEHFEQGAQRFLREHPATKVYSALVNRYSAVVKQLLDQLPEAERGASEAEALLEFLKGKGRRQCRAQLHPRVLGPDRIGRRRRLPPRP